MSAKRIMIIFMVISLLAALTACGAEDQKNVYAITSEQEISKNYDPAETRAQRYTSKRYDTLEDLCEAAQIIVRAHLETIEKFDEGTNCYCFAVDNDYFGNAESVIHVYDDASSYYECGGEYILFLNSVESRFYPHLIYSRYCADFLVREYLLNGETVYDFRNPEYTLGLSSTSDIDALIKGYARNNSQTVTIAGTPEIVTAAEAVEGSELIISITITEVEPVNRYVSSARYVIDSVIKGQIAETEANILVPPETEPDGEYLLLMKRENSSFVLVSDELGMLEAGSAEAAEVMSVMAESVR